MLKLYADKNLPALPRFNPITFGTQSGDLNCSATQPQGISTGLYNTKQNYNITEAMERNYICSNYCGEKNPLNWQDSTPLPLEYKVEIYQTARPPSPKVPQHDHMTQSKITTLPSWKEATYAQIIAQRKTSQHCQGSIPWPRGDFSHLNTQP